MQPYAPIGRNEDEAATLKRCGAALVHAMLVNLTINKIIVTSIHIEISTSCQPIMHCIVLHFSEI